VKEIMGTPWEQRPVAPLEESTSFIGRRTELAEGRLLLGASRLVTLTGAGGVGKTRLARQLAKSVARTFQNSVWFVPLDQATAGSDIADTAAATLQVHSYGQESTMALTDYLADNKVLLVLDNCEHVLRGAAQLTQTILQKCRNVTVLATSREPLALSYESVMSVARFDVGTDDARTSSADAVVLFLDRARAVVPGYKPTSVELGTIAQICARLEGLPLAIEMAAARIRVASPTEILERLKSPLSFLGQRLSNVPPRQRSLRSSIGWTFELCTPQERWMWTHLSVFAGIWDLDAAEAIADTSTLRDESAIDVLQSLIEKSVIVGHHEAGEHWYGMLRLIRDFGREELTSNGELTTAQKAHAAWYVRRLHQAEDDWVGPHQTRWLSFFVRELPNLRAALEFNVSKNGNAADALRLTTVAWRISWEAVGRIDEHRRWLSRALAASTLPTTERAQALTLDAVLAHSQGHNTLARQEIFEAQVIADGLGDVVLDAALAGGQAQLLGDPARSLELRKKAAAAQEQYPYLTARLNASTQLAMAYLRIGDTVNAALWREVSLHTSRATGERYESSNLLLQSGAFALERGNVHVGRDLLQQSLELKKDLANIPSIGHTEERLAFAAVLEQNFTLAAALLGAAQSAWRTAGGLPLTVTDILDVREKTGRAAKAGMGDKAFTRAFDRGRALTIEDGIALALGAAVTRPTAGTPEPSHRSTPQKNARLSTREQQVAELVAQGLSDKQIATSLLLAQRTAEGHVQNALVKLGFTSRTQLGVWSRDQDNRNLRK
jgi:predicted ATPase/DNA-binding CsgD family transcriptional regulator